MKAELLASKRNMKFYHGRTIFLPAPFFCIFRFSLFLDLILHFSDLFEAIHFDTQTTPLPL